MRRCNVMGVVVLGLAGVALGQEAQPPKDDGPLAGPRVRQQRVPGEEQGFSEARRGRQGQGLPHRAFMQAIAGLRGEGENPAPEEIRLTPEQTEKIKALDTEFTGTMRDHAQKTRRANAGTRRPNQRDRAPEAGDAPPDRPPGEEGDRAMMRERAEEARRGAPKAGEWHTKMYSVLTEPQREYVDGRVAAWRKQAEERFGEEYAQRRMRERAAGAPGAPPPPEGAPPPARERLRRIAEMIGQLPPEERERLLSRLEQELQRRVEQKARPDEPAPGGPDQPARPPRPGR